VPSALEVVDERVFAKRVETPPDGVNATAMPRAALPPHGVPGSTGESGEIPVSIPKEPLDAGKELGIRPPAIEQGGLVPTGKRSIDDRATKELRPPRTAASPPVSATHLLSRGLLMHEESSRVRALPVLAHPERPSVGEGVSGGEP